MSMHNQDRFFVLVMTLLVFYVIYLLSPVLSPFLVGILLAYLANPLVTKLMTLHLSRTASVVIVYGSLIFLFLLSLIILVPFIALQLNALANFLIDLVAWIQSAILPWLSENFHIDIPTLDIESFKTFMLENWMKAGSVTADLLQSVLHSGSRFLSASINLLITIVATFYFMCDWELIITKIQGLIPPRNRATVTEVVLECNEVVGAFLHGQLTVMLVLSMIYSLGLTVLGLQMGLLIGIAAGLLSIIPYLGSIVGIVIAGITAFMQFGSLTMVAMVLLVFLIGQFVEGFYLTPKLVGSRVGLHPLAVIFAVLSGSCLFGLVGALLAVPVSAVLMVWARYGYKVMNQQASV